MQDKSNFLVNLNIIVGEISTRVKELVQAANEAEASEKVIELHARYELEWDDDHAGAFDCHGEVFIKVIGVQQIPEEDAAILKKYL